MERTVITDDLNRLLRDELSATETYRQALDRIRAEYAHDARFEQLTEMLHDHEWAAAQLRELIQQLGGAASNDSGTWGSFATTVMGAARLLGDRAALTALRQGEATGVREYRSLLRERTPTEAEIRQVLTAIVSREEEHLHQLDQLIEAA